MINLKKTVTGSVSIAGYSAMVYRYYFLNILFAHVTYYKNDLDLLTQWSYKWQISFNAKKCEFLRITSKKKLYAIATNIN